MILIRDLLKELDEGVYDEKLARLYCLPVEALGPCRDRVRRVVEGFRTVFQKDDATRVAVYSAPGRTEIGGNHTDHQRGKVLTGSVDLDALACAAANGSDVVNIYSEGYGTITLDITHLGPVKAEKNTTAALIRGVLTKVISMGYPVAGFDAYVSSNVPGGSGLSSSACFEVLVGMAANGLFCHGTVELQELAEAGQFAENIYFGKPSGLLDQMGCAMGGIIAIDFGGDGKPKVHEVDMDFSGAGYALCIVDTGADHADLTADYAAVPAEMKAVAAEFGKKFLSDVSEAEFYSAIPALREKHGDRAVLRAIHFFDDCRRVEEQVAALERRDLDGFLRSVNESGRSSFMYLQNISTYRDPADQPVAVALAVAGHLLGGQGAVRVHGGGFAGTIQAFVPLDKVPAFKAGMDGLLGEGACRVTNIRPVGGCILID